MENHIQYIVDNQGHKKSVVVPYNEWESLQREKELLLNKIKFLEELKDSVDEVKEALGGKKKTKALSDFLDEV
jgi:PHD/YefM family antitoxin component YafN of YafNO toxin-antitoxin module